MRINLVFPPDHDPTRPNVSLPMVQAVLKQDGFSDIELIDVNLHAYWYLLDPLRLEQAYGAIRVRLGELESGSGLSVAEGEEYLELAQASLSAPYIIAHISEALSVFRSWDRFVNLEDYAWANRVLIRGMRLAAAPYFPTSLLFDDKFHLANESTKDVLDTIHRDKYIFTEFYSNEIVPSFRSSDPRLVIFNVHRRGQLIPALKLALLIKKNLPLVHINFIGAVIHYNTENFSKWDRLFDIVDSLTLGAYRQYEGGFSVTEEIVSLARALNKEDGLEKVPNLMYRDEHSGGTQRTPPVETTLKIDRLPTPDFDGLADEKYFTPEVIWPLALSKGCYWRRCTFCTRLAQYEARSVDNILQDMKNLALRYNAKYFYFPDDAIHPDLFRSLSTRLIANLPGVYWHSMAHPHKKYTLETCQMMYRAGCRLLEWGIESAAPRILKALRKGADLQLMRNVLENCYTAGINARAFIIVGFPTETPDEAKQTLEFLVENEKIISSARIQRFVLEPSSYIALNPDKFGITKIIPNPDRDLAMNLEFEVTAGSGVKEGIDTQTKALEKLNLVYKDHVTLHTFRTHAFLHTIYYKNSNLMYSDFHPTKMIDLTKEEILNSIIEPAMSGPIGTYRYKLQKHVDNEIDRRIQKMNSGKSNKNGEGQYARKEAIDRELILHPLAEPLNYAYFGENDAIFELTKAIGYLINMLRSDQTLNTTLDSLPIDNREQVLAFIQALIRRGILKVKDVLR